MYNNVKRFSSYRRTETTTLHKVPRGLVYSFDEHHCIPRDLVYNSILHQVHDVCQNCRPDLKNLFLPSVQSNSTLGVHDLGLLPLFYICTKLLQILSSAKVDAYNFLVEQIFSVFLKIKPKNGF